ncbi:hypothetical protein, partial [Lysinibacillus xylanilyticus]|uniref:hypothetical protein n=1 Tax=Lysinibacillus xylanilyticus TaxID=582475 RepID=UPI003D09097C
MSYPSFCLFNGRSARPFRHFALSFGRSARSFRRFALSFRRSTWPFRRLLFYPSLCSSYPSLRPFFPSP